MIWYLDTETVQLNTQNIGKIDKGQYTEYINKRLKMSQNFVDRMYKEEKETGEAQTILVLNVFNAGINDRDEVVTAKRPDIFFKKIAKIVKNNGERYCTCYYHNLKFDMTNILDFFKTEECKFTVKSSLIVKTKWYNYRFTYQGVMFSFLDSYNLTMSKLRDFGKAFGLPKELWKTDYEFDFSKVENINKMIRGDRVLEDYCIQDVRCLKSGVEAFKKFANVDKMTLASTAFANWETTKHPPLANLTLEEQIDANYTYTGAICYVNPMYKEKDITGQFVYIDNNGLYSASGYSKCAGFEHPYPIGMGVKKTGIPDIWNIHKYYTIRATIFAVVKTDTTIPFFRLGKQSALGVQFQRTYPENHPDYDPKNPDKKWWYKQNEYLTEINETCYINSIDLRLLFKYYHVNKIVYDYFWEYETAVGIFDEYSDHWIAEKTIGTKTHNAPRKTVAKFMNNSLTGKFGQKIEPVETVIEFNEKDNILEHVHRRMKKQPKMIYMPIVSAILAYAREIFMDMTNSYPKEHFLYADTDSNIMTREAFFKYIDKSKMHRSKLGYWDIENDITRIKILRQKTYMFTRKRSKIVYKKDGDFYITQFENVCRCAGATEQVKEFLTYENFELGRQIKGATQLKPRLIPGGTALIETPYVLRQSFMW